MTRFPLVLMCVLAAACAEKPDQEAAPSATMQTSDASADQAALDKVRADYESNYNSHDATLVANMFTDSAYALWADGHISSSRAAVEAQMKETISAGSPNLSLKNGDTMVFGDDAVSHGTYSVSAKGPDGQATAASGSYLTYFHRVNGEWKINGVITNFDAPPPADMPMANDMANPPPDDGTMKDVTTAWTNAFSAGDWATLAGMYTQDAAVSFSNAPEIRGGQAIQARFADRYGDSKPQIEIHDVGTVDLGDDHALDGGWYVVHATTPDGTMQQGGTYLNVMQKQADGSWKIQWSVTNGQPKTAK